MARYLSLEWIDEIASFVSDNDVLQALNADQELGVTQVVSDGPEGDVVYHLQVDTDGVRFAAGQADPEHVRMEQSWATAVAVATGELNAQEAFVNGDIVLTGDQQRLLPAQPIFAQLDAAFSAVRPSTTYA